MSETAKERPAANADGCTLELSRRQWLGATAAGAGLLAMGVRVAAAEPPRGFIDAHVHVWTDDLAKVPLASGWTKVGMKPASFTAEQLMEHAKPCGVTRVVLIQMSFYGFDNSYMLATMQRFPGVYSGVAVIDSAREPDKTMRALAKQGVRGFRIHPGKQQVEPWISSDGMATMWKTAADTGLAMCCLIDPVALPAIDRMCAKYPAAPVVIDHVARIGADGEIRAADVDNLCRLARHKQACVKVSAFYALGKRAAPYTDLGPTIRRLLDEFGRERLMWASDCPFQVQEGHTYRDSIELIHSRLDFLTAEDREWLLSKSAEKFFFS